MMKFGNLNNWNKTDFHKIILGIVIILLLMCPNPTGKVREYTTSILGKITLIIVTIAVICYDPIIGIFAIILLLKCSGVGGVVSKTVKEGFTGGDDEDEEDEEDEGTDSKRMQFINEHCACKGMYDPNTGLRKQGVKYKAMCKRVKSDSPEWQDYAGGIMFNRIPNVAVGELTPSGAKKNSEEYKQNLKEYKENFDKSKPNIPLVFNMLYPGMPIFLNMDDNIDPKHNMTDDKQTLSKIRFTGSKICNPCDLDGCTEWELTNEGGGSSSFSSKSSRKKKKEESEKQTTGDKISALFD